LDSLTARREARNPGGDVLVFDLVLVRWALRAHAQQRGQQNWQISFFLVIPAKAGIQRLSSRMSKKTSEFPPSRE